MATGHSSLPFARPQTRKTLRGSFRPRQLRPGTQATALCCYGAFKHAVCIRLPGFKPLKRSVAASRRHSSHSHLFLRAFKDTPKTLRGSFDQALRPQPSVVKGSSLPFAMLPKRSAAASTGCSSHSHLFLRVSKDTLRPQPSLFNGVQACRLPCFKPFFKGHLFLNAFKLAVCQPSNHQTLRGSFGLLIARLPKPNRTTFLATSTVGLTFCPQPWATDCAGNRHQGQVNCFSLAFQLAIREPSKDELAAAARNPTLQPMLSKVQRLSVSLLFFAWALLSGTCQCFFWHRFPDGVSCVTAIRPRDCDDQTTAGADRATVRMPFPVQYIPS